MIRLADPNISDDDIAAAVSVLRSGWLVQGEAVERFEASIAKALGVHATIAVSSGTAALHLSLIAAGIQRGMKVAVSAYSWPATANVIALCGAEPRFIDIDPSAFAMDPALLERELRQHPDIKAILPVHPFGRLADMPALCNIASQYDVPVVEDAACAIGAEAHGRPAGAWGTLGCFSFHPRKVVTTGEGGLIATNQHDLARRLRRLRNHGLEHGPDGIDFVEPGFNYRLTEFQAAIGITQFARLWDTTATRQRLADEYVRLLGTTSWTWQDPGSIGTHVYQAFIILLPRALAPKRTWLIAELRTRGIEVAIGTYHIPLTTYFRKAGGYAPGDFPVTDDVAARALALPLHGRLTAADQEYVVEQLITAASKIGGSA